MTIAMGSIYMDKGEGADYVRSQVERMKRQRPEQYFLDIICRPNQIAEAINLLQDFYEQVSDIMPLEKVYTAITCDDEIRPAAIAIAYLTQSAEIKIRDINPDRPGR